MYALMSGAVCALSAVAACALFRSYWRLGDRFFAYFAAAFALFGASQLFLGIRNLPEGNYPYAYVPRLLVFVLILIAIVEKNRAVRRPKTNADAIDDDDLTQQRLRRAVR
ncbi:MAG: DUF5985 family protein [Vulcanimicrobiaceae bacterium]